MNTDDSVNQMLNEVRNGDNDAINAIWDRCFPDLVRQAGRKLARKGVKIVDAEDVAISVFESFCRAAQNGRFPDLDDKNGLWRLLSTMTRRKVIDWMRKQTSRPLPVESVQLEAISQSTDDPGIELMIAEETTRLISLLPDKYRPVAYKKLEGCSNREIARSLEISEPTVERHLRFIRNVWAKELQN